MRLIKLKQVKQICTKDNNQTDILVRGSKPLHMQVNAVKRQLRA